MNAYPLTKVAIPAVATPANPSVVEVLEVFRALCLPCLVVQTGARLESVLLELETLRADVAERRCAVCEEDWPVFATMGRLMTLPGAERP